MVKTAQSKILGNKIKSHKNKAKIFFVFFLIKSSSSNWVIKATVIDMKLTAIDI